MVRGQIPLFGEDGQDECERDYLEAFTEDEEGGWHS